MHALHVFYPAPPNNNMHISKLHLLQLYTAKTFWIYESAFMTHFSLHVQLQIYRKKY
jgi:hypothetical protein